MARPEGFEPPTPRFVVWCSIQLSYGRLERRHIGRWVGVGKGLARKPFEQGPVHRRQVERSGLAKGEPAPPLPFPSLGISAPGGRCVKLENKAGTPLVRRFLGDSGRVEPFGNEFDSQLFQYLAAQRKYLIFLIFYLPAGKLPPACMALVRRALLQQQAPRSVAESCGHYRDGCRTIFHVNLSPQRFISIEVGEGTHRAVRPGGQSMRGSQFFKQLLRDDRGATAIEYGLILALICVTIIVSLQALAGENRETWTIVEEESTNAMDGTVPPVD